MSRAGLVGHEVDDLLGMFPEHSQPGSKSGDGDEMPAGSVELSDEIIESLVILVGDPGRERDLGCPNRACDRRGVHANCRTTRTSAMGSSSTSWGAYERSAGMAGFLVAAHDRAIRARRSNTGLRRICIRPIWIIERFLQPSVDISGNR